WGLGWVVRLGASVEAVEGRRVAGGQKPVGVRGPAAPERERATVDREVCINRALGAGRAVREVRAARGIGGVEAAGVGAEGPRCGGRRRRRGEREDRGEPHGQQGKGPSGDGYDLVIAVVTPSLARFGVI